MAKIRRGEIWYCSLEMKEKLALLLLPGGCSWWVLVGYIYFLMGSRWLPDGLRWLLLFLGPRWLLLFLGGLWMDNMKIARHTSDQWYGVSPQGC